MKNLSENGHSDKSSLTCTENAVFGIGFSNSLGIVYFIQSKHVSMDPKIIYSNHKESTLGALLKPL